MPVKITLPKIQSGSDLPGALAVIAKRMASGEITPTEAGEVAKVLDAYAKAYELSDLQKRMEELEKNLEKQKHDTNNRNY